MRNKHFTASVDHSKDTVLLQMTVVKHAHKHARTKHAIQCQLGMGTATVGNPDFVKVSQRSRNSSAPVKNPGTSTAACRLSDFARFRMDDAALALPLFLPNMDCKEDTLLIVVSNISNTSHPGRSAHVRNVILQLVRGECNV